MFRSSSAGLRIEGSEKFQAMSSKCVDGVGSDGTLRTNSQTS